MLFSFREDLVQANKRISSSLRAGIRAIEKVRPKKGRKEKKKRGRRGKEERKEGRRKGGREEKRGGEGREGKGKKK